MALHALLFSRDQAIIDLAEEVLKTLDIEVTQSSAEEDAVQRLANTKFDAIIVDNADARGAVEVLSAAKSLPSCEQSIGIVLAISPSSIALADGARSHMVLYRPLSADRLRTGVRSALRLRSDGEEARESPRASIRIPATLRGAGLDVTLAFITNLSAGGAALYVGQSIPSASIQTIEFSLPGEKDNLSTAVELIWRDVQGGMGIRFAGMSAAFAESLEKWSADHSEEQRAAEAGA
jgi:PilZ domain-containing protein